MRQCFAPKWAEKTEEGLTNLFCRAQPRRERLQQEKGPSMRSTRARVIDPTNASTAMVRALAFSNFNILTLSPASAMVDACP